MIDDWMPILSGQQSIKKWLVANDKNPSRFNKRSQDFWLLQGLKGKRLSVTFQHTYGPKQPRSSLDLLFSRPSHYMVSFPGRGGSFDCDA